MALTILLALLPMLLSAQKLENNKGLVVQKVSTGKLDVYPNFHSNLIRQRDVAVWMPEGYAKGQPVDVLYMHDGQQIFDSLATWNHQEWEVDEVMGRLITDNTIRPTIVVAIANIGEDRLVDYFPQKAWNYLGDSEKAKLDYDKLNADRYLRFIVEELKPFIDREYQPLTTAEHTFVMGSSMGGLISLYAVCEYPQMFGGAGCLSTHVPLILSDELVNNPAAVDRWAAAFRSYVKDKLAMPNTHLIYMDRGSVGLDGLYKPYQDLMDQQFKAQGWDARHFVTIVFEGHQHMEIYWAQRLEQPLKFLLGR